MLRGLTSIILAATTLFQVARLIAGSMPINIIDFPAIPECGGTQWSVVDEDQLAKLTALVLVGRSHLAERILDGAQNQAPMAPAALKENLRLQLFPAAGPPTFHRDGLLFEIICWIVAHITSGPNEVVSEPHLASTTQGLDTLKVKFDPATRNVELAVIYEQKCTENARQLFLSQVLPAFRKWMSGIRDSELLQATIGLMRRFNLTDDEYVRVYDRLIKDRPLAFRAALTVNPEPFSSAQCVALFAGYIGLTPTIDDRNGDTFPLADIRTWFAAFSNKVWAAIEAPNV